MTTQRADLRGLVEEGYAVLNERASPPLGSVALSPTESDLHYWHGAFLKMFARITELDRLSAPGEPVAWAMQRLEPVPRYPINDADIFVNGHGLVVRWADVCEAITEATVEEKPT